jgi:membrane protein
VAAQQPQVDREDSPSFLRRSAALAGRVLRAAFSDRTMMVAGGLAFFGLFGLFPALAAATLALGRFVPDEVAGGGLAGLQGLVPDPALRLVDDFLKGAKAGLGVGVGLAVNLAIVIWCVQRSASGLITALNIAYDETEKRSRLRREAVALAAAGGVIAVLLAATLLIGGAPLLADRLEPPAAALVTFARWPLLALLTAFALDVLYAFAPSRTGRRWTFVSWGAAVATLIWLAASAAFSHYMRSIGDWGPFYGSLSAAVVLLTWLFITALAILLGAELNAHLAARREWRKESLNEELERREHAEED